MRTFTSLANEWLRSRLPATAAEQPTFAESPCVSGLNHSDAGSPRLPPVIAPSAKATLVQNPVYWAEDFARWARAHCLFRDGCLWSAAALHEHFCAWCIAEKTVGCMLPTFAALLELEGFTVMADMVCGLVLNAEYLALATRERTAKEMSTWSENRR